MEPKGGLKSPCLLPSCKKCLTGDGRASGGEEGWEVSLDREAAQGIAGVGRDDVICAFCGETLGLHTLISAERR